MTTPAVFARRKAELQTLLQSLEDGSASSVTWMGQTYTSSPADVEMLTLRYEIVSAKASLEAAESAQAFQEGPRTQTRAQLRDLQQLVKDLEAKLARRLRGGALPMSYGVPR